MQYGLIGEYLGHSYSKLIQERLLKDYTYDLCPIEKDDLDTFMTKKEFKAINVTIPYKKSVIPYLSTMDEACQKIQAVNTIVNRNGDLYGYNTDYYGFLYMIQKHGVTIKNKKVLVLGNGGASQAIQAVIKDLDAKTMLITDIIPSKNVLSIQDVYNNHNDVDVVINTTPCGMYPNTDSVACDLSYFKYCEAVFDCVYNPLQTKLTMQAKMLNIPVAVTGLEMLVAQAKKALEYFKDITIEDEKIDNIYREILAQTSNLIIVTKDEELCKEVAKACGKTFNVLNQADIFTLAKESNQVLMIHERLVDVNKSKLLANGFIVNGSSVDEIVKEYNRMINAY